MIETNINRKHLNEMQHRIELFGFCSSVTEWFESLKACLYYWGKTVYGSAYRTRVSKFPTYFYVIGYIPDPENHDRKIHTEKIVVKLDDKTKPLQYCFYDEFENLVFASTNIVDFVYQLHDMYPGLQIPKYKE